MNRYITHIAAAFLAVSAGTSCVKEKLEVTYNNQEAKIDTYINTNRYKDAEKTEERRVVNNGGSNRLVIEEGTGDGLSEKGTVAFYYAGYTFNGNKSKANMFITNHEETALASQWELTDADYRIYQINMADAELLEGLRNGLLGVKRGEHSEILFTGKYGFGNKEFGIIPANSALLYEIWVVDVSND